MAEGATWFELCFYPATMTFLLVLSSGESSGGFAEYTQRGILLVLYDAGMTAAITRQLAIGLQEYVVSDGV